VLVFNILINVLQNIKVSLEKIATALPIPILFLSRRKKVRDFYHYLLLKTLWFPIIKDWASQNLQIINLSIW